MEDSRLMFRDLWRGNAYRLPWLYEAQQRTQVRMRARRRSVHEAEFVLLRDLGLPERPLCLDVGANRGQSIVSFKAVLPDATVASFEPEPVAYRAAAKVGARFADVTVHPFGLGASDATLTLSVPKCRRVRFPQLASTLRDPERVAAIQQAGGFWWVDAVSVTYDDTEVQVRTLDSLGLRPDVVKIDVEGGEAAVLAGGHRTIEQHRPVVMIEPNIEALTMLAGMGYERVGGGDALVVLTSRCCPEGA